MAARKKKLSAADAAYLRMQDAAEGRAPLPPGVLPGQLNLLDDSVAGECRIVDPALPREYTKLDCVPRTCPSCAIGMLDGSGGRWSPMTFNAKHPTLQCANCALIIEVPVDAWERVLRARHAALSASDRLPLKKVRAPRQRGAG